MGPFNEFFIDILKNQYADFNGRARRKQFWMYILFYMAIYIVVSIIAGAIGLGFIAMLYSLGLLVPSIAITARRLHDTGRSGWWQLIGLIPLIGLIVMIIFTVQDSQDDNQYGPNPKAGETGAEAEA